MYTRGCTRAKPFFPPVLNPATIPNNTQTFGKDTSERYCELFLVSDFSVTFSHNRLVNTLFQQYSHKTKWNPIRNEERRVQLLQLLHRSFVRIDHAEISFLVIPFIFPRRHAIIPLHFSNKPYDLAIFENSKISKQYPNDTFLIYFEWYRVIDFSLLEKKKRKHTSSVQTTSNCSFFSFKN